MHGNVGARDGGLKCLDLMTGETKWSQQLGFGSLLAAAGKLIVLTERGEMVIAKAQPSGFEEIARCRAVELGRGDVCWSAPVLIRGRLVCRSTGGEMVCLDVRK
jgi:outer membrane protein assembly factor BamB